MEDFYHELWGAKEERHIIHHTIDIPQPEHALQPGYKMAVEEAVKNIVPSQVYTRISTKNITGMSIKSRVPVGKKEILVREEYDRIIKKLVEAEKKRFSAPGVLNDGALLDYQIAGQPGSGEYFVNLYAIFSVSNTNNSKPKGNLFFCCIF